MAQLRDPKREALAQGLFMGKTQLQVYREAGYKGASAEAASKVCRHPEVQERLAELVRERHVAQREINERALEQESVTKGWIVRHAKFITQRAIRGTKPIYGENGVVTGWMPTGRDDGNAINAMRLLSQLGGYLIEKVEVGQPGDFARLSDDDLIREMITVGESIGIDRKQIEKAIEGSGE